MQIYFRQKWEEGNKLWKINSKLTEMRLVPKFRETLILNWRNAVSNKFNATLFLSGTIFRRKIY